MRLLHALDNGWFKILTRIQSWADWQEEKYRARRYIRTAGARLTRRELDALERRRQYLSGWARSHPPTHRPTDT